MKISLYEDQYDIYHLSLPLTAYVVTYRNKVIDKLAFFWNVIIVMLFTRKTHQTRSRNTVVMKYFLKNYKIKKTQQK